MSAKVYHTTTRHGGRESYAKCNKCKDWIGDAWRSQNTTDAAEAQRAAAEHNESEHAK
jgi:hypothetical protein